MTIASMFGLEDQVDSLMEGFHERISVLQEIAENKTAIVGMCTSGILYALYFYAFVMRWQVW